MAKGGRRIRWRCNANRMRKVTRNLTVSLRGRELSAEDKTHQAKIVVALKEEL